MEAKAESEPGQEHVGESELQPEPEPEPERNEEPGSVFDSLRCVPIGNCGDLEWCDQKKYDDWCRVEAQARGCPRIFCETLPSLAQLPAKKYLRPAKRRVTPTNGVLFFQTQGNSHS